MSAPISHKLIVRDDGRIFIVTGNPGTGYSAVRVSGVEWVGEFKRSWQAINAAHEWTAEAHRG